MRVGCLGGGGGWVGDGLEGVGVEDATKSKLLGIL